MIESERRVRLFRNNRDQALCIPREFELEGNEAMMRKESHRPIVEPAQKGQLVKLLARLEPLGEEFPKLDDDLPPLDEVNI